MKDSIIPDEADVWAELWKMPNGEINFKFHTKLPTFGLSETAMQEFRDIIQNRLDNASQCPVNCARHRLEDQ